MCQGLSDIRIEKNYKETDLNPSDNRRERRDKK